MPLRGTATATVQNATTISVTVSGISIQNGDMVLLAVAGNGTGDTLGWPSGFAVPAGITPVTISGDATETCCVAYKIASSEGSSYTVSGLNAGGNSSIECRVYDGRSGVFTAVSQKAATAATYPLSFSITGLTAAAADDICMFIMGTGHYQAQLYSLTSAPSGFANSVFATSNGNTYQPYVGACDEIGAAAGATGSLTGVVTATGGVLLSQQYCGFVLSMAQALLMGQACL